jgi:dihydropteroate synthase
MGVLNLTPDSFSDGGRYLSPAAAAEKARTLIHEGADILDLGAESTRPGAETVTEMEELARVLPVLEEIRKFTNIPVSVDTTKPEVARQCLALGADIINDVSGLRDSGAAMADLVRETGAGLVLMHRRGNPQTMQSLAAYGDVVKEVMAELEADIAFALDRGISRDQLVIDPGLGFAKTTEQNLEILQSLERFQELRLPVLAGPSRKSFIGKITGREVTEREFGTAAVCAVAVTKGVQVLRVHDAGKMGDVVKIVEAIQGVKHVRT